jgi:hypothetical protein
MPDPAYDHDVNQEGLADALEATREQAVVPPQAWPPAGGRLLEHTPRPAAAAVPDLWQSYAYEDPAVYANLYRAAADLIDAQGYDAADDYEGAHGISVAAALAEVARDRAGAELEQGTAVYGDDQWARHLATATDMWRRELEIRLGAVLYATGQQLYDHSSHLTDVYRDWEKRWNHDAPAPDQNRATGLLRTAAAVYDLLGQLTDQARQRRADELDRMWNKQ